MEMSNKDFGKRIKELRNEYGITQKELAKKLGVSQSTIAKYEYGERKITLTFIQELAKIFDITEDEIIGTKKEKELYKFPPHFDKYTLKWYEAVGELNFNEHEFQELVNYAKYIVSKRKIRKD